MGVDEKQLVAHLCTFCQKVLSLEREAALGVKRSAPQRRMGAMSELANLWHREGASPAMEGLRRLISAKAPCARAMRREKWVEVARARVNQYPNHRSESRGCKSSPSS